MGYKTFKIKLVRSKKLDGFTLQLEPCLNDTTLLSLGEVLFYLMDGNQFNTQI